MAVASAAQAGQRFRDPRVKVLVPCRMKHGAGWGDACIHNVSTRGLLVAADEAPKPGSYVDIRRGSLVIVGRVMWRRDRYFGVRTQDIVSVPALTQATRTPSNDEAQSPGDRRAGTRLAAEGRIARRVEQSQRVASLVQYGVFALLAGVAALVLASEVGSMLSRPLSAIEAALGGG